MAFVFVHGGIKARVQVRSLLPRLVSKGGMTIGNTIHLRGGQESVTSYLLAHEFAHILQWRSYGVVGFLRRYLSGLAKHGYSIVDHPMESEAHAFGMVHAPAFEGYAKAIRGGK